VPEGSLAGTNARRAGIPRPWSLHERPRRSGRRNARMRALRGRSIARGTRLRSSVFEVRGAACPLRATAGYGPRYARGCRAPENPVRTLARARAEAGTRAAIARTRRARRPRRREHPPAVTRPS